MPHHEQKDELRVDEKFYNKLGVDDDKALANIEGAIELYQGKHDRAGRTDAAINFEKSLSMLSVSFVRLCQEILRATDGAFSPEQRLFLNFGVVDPRLFSSLTVIGDLVAEIDSRQPSERFESYYMDEWLERIARGAIAPTSEAAKVKSKTKSQEVEDARREKKRKLEIELESLSGEELDAFVIFKDLYGNYYPDADQNGKLKDLTDIRKTVSNLERIIKEQNAKMAEIESLTVKETAGGGTIAESRRSTRFARMREEFDILVTVMRSCAARGGLVKNTPALIDKWIPMDSRVSVNTIAHVESKFSEFESLDYTIFTDAKGVRKAPKVLVLPGVGAGMAWKDRIMVSLFPPPATQPDISLIKTFAGYRWHIATSSFNWKHLPGELGSMYQLIYPDLTYNNLEKSFTDDYVNWMTKEAQGFQVLSAQTRILFWKKIPFPAEYKRKLSKRAAAYAKLYAEDLARGIQS